MRKVLFFAAWYPTRFDAMAGLFVQRHANVVALNNKVAVLHVTSDPSAHYCFEIEIKELDNVLTVIVYFKKISDQFFLFTHLLKAIFWLLAFLKGVRTIINIFGRPDCIHVHVLTLRLGTMAFFLSRFFRVPYFITEHSSYFLPEKNISRNWLWAWLTRWLTSKSKGVSAVSNRLKEAMMTKGYTNKHFVVIRNVVPDIFFQIGHEYRPKEKIIFSNITCFDDYVKNISGIIRTVNKLRHIRQDFQLRLIGDGPDKAMIEKMVDELGLRPFVHFTGLLFDQQLAEEIVLSDFTVLFSHYETMAVVIAESLACGRPVVATKAGGIPELINHNNGLLVQPGD
ncbi:MAG: glycosyltransferase, partial [Bacteroidales bacterium]|nr:glycosyltransferase [Bacteroidales bacterium]